MKSFDTVAVIGAGTMGSAIAQHFLMKGLKVRLVDNSEAGLERGRVLIRESLDEALERRLLDRPGFEATLEHLHPTLATGDLADCDLVVEAVFEDLELKRRVLAGLEAVVRPDCILATNTSSFLITDVAEGLTVPERVIGTHYFYHAAKNKLIEIVPGRQTDPALADELEGFYAELGKTPVRTADAPGFAVNRFFVPWLNEAVRLWEEGLGSITVIDVLARETFGVGMGPFALMNATGVPIARHAAEGLASRLDDFYRPAASLVAQVEAGKDWDTQDRSVINGGSEQPAAVRRRLLGAALGCAAELVSENVCDATGTDQGARSGLRWPRGPFELMLALGFDEARGCIDELFGRWSRPVPEVPFKRAPKPLLEWVRHEVHDRTGVIVFNLPDRMNALGETVVEQLEAAWKALDEDPRVERVFITGRGKAFVAGADIRFFLDNMAAGRLDRIQRFTERGQRLLRAFETSRKPTVAFLDGLVLGGGLELALACRYRLGTRNTRAGFPETGIGIYPGLGGTQRTPRLIGRGLAKYMVATGAQLGAKQALEFGLIDAVVEPVRHHAELARLALPDKQSGRRPQDELEAAFAGYDGRLDAGVPESGPLAEHARTLSRKAPIALQTAMALIDRGRDKPLEAAIGLELEGLETIFSTTDAWSGLSAVISGRRPEFKGA